MSLRIRELRPPDQGPIGTILKATGVFYDEEIKVALELVDLALTRPDQTDYVFICAESDGRLSGYACYGPVPMTDRSWDLYWIAVDPEAHGRGVGRAILGAMEADLRARGARKVFVDTSGRPAYLPTRRFYEATGYKVAARLEAFYKVEDDKVVYSKDLGR